MNRLGLSRTSPILFFITSLSLGGVGCGGTGDGDDDDSGTGGMGASGGSGGMSGTTGGSGGMATAAPPKYPFELDEEGWSVQYVSCGKDAEGEPVKCITPADVTVAWASGVGDGDGQGALRAEVGFTGPRQYAGIGLQLGGEDMTNVMFTARVKLESGLAEDAELATNSVGAKLYLKSGADYVYAAGAYQTITSHGGWFTLKFDLSNPGTWSYVDTSHPTMFDPTTIGELGVQVDTADSLTSTATDATWLIDNVRW
jgi:hypothetical protein